MKSVMVEIHERDFLGLKEARSVGARLSQWTSPTFWLLHFEALSKHFGNAYEAMEKGEKECRHADIADTRPPED